MDDEQTVVLKKNEWQQLVAILANATGWLTVNKLFQQLQTQDPGVMPPGFSPPGDGVDSDAEVLMHQRRVPRN